MNACSLSSVFSVLNESSGHLHFSHVSPAWLSFLMTAGGRFHKALDPIHSLLFSIIKYSFKRRNSQFTMVSTDAFYDPKRWGKAPEIILVITGN